MPITYAFTFTAFLAVSLHGWYLGRVYRNRVAARLGHEPAYVQAVARALSRVETVRFALNAVMLIAGCGIIAGGPFRMLGYLLAVVPLLSMIASTIALRGL